MKLNLKQYAEKAGKYSNEEAEKALQPITRYMDVGTHEVTIKDFRKLKGVDGTEAELVFSKDPNWVMFCPVFENSQGATSNLTVMMPIADKTMYTNPETQKESGFVFAKFITFITAMGFSPEASANERPEAPFIAKVIETDGAALELLKGMQFKMRVYWREGTYHAKYVSSEKVYYLANANEEVIHDEPFQPDPNKKGDERWEEMIKICKLNKLAWNNQHEVEILQHDTAKNNLAPFFVKKVTKPSPVKKVAEVTEEPEA